MKVYAVVMLFPDWCGNSEHTKTFHVGAATFDEAKKMVCDKYAHATLRSCSWVGDLMLAPPKDATED